MDMKYVSIAGTWTGIKFFSRLMFLFLEEGYGKMKKAQISVPLVVIEPATLCMRGGSLKRSATRLTKI